MEKLRSVLLDEGASIALRNRAAFWLRERPSDDKARAALREAVVQKGDSLLLRHEIAYILGQMGNEDAVETLCGIVRDSSDAAIVRHEAAEALGAIGSTAAIATLEAHADDSMPEVAETCSLALDLMRWRANNSLDDGNAYKSVDPAPASDSKNVESLSHTLLDDDVSLWDKYRAMFALRDIGSKEAVSALATAVVLPRERLKSDLLRHELAFVLGQLASDDAKDALEAILRDTTMHSMVRHEAAEALGALKPDTVTHILESFSHETTDDDNVVTQSCEVALDAVAYYSSSS